MGIYQIRNLINNKKYIGSSINIKKRHQQHFKALLNENHHSFSLQKAWKKYGKQSFAFEILDIITNKNNLIKYEQLWIDFIKPEYNVCQIAGSSLGRTVLYKTREKLSIITKNQKNNKFRLKGELAVNYGKKHSSERKQNASNRSKGKNNPFFNKKHSKEVRKLISDNNKGNYCGSSNLSSKVTENDVLKIRELFATGEYLQQELADMFNLDQTSVSLIVRRKTWKHI